VQCAVFVKRKLLLPTGLVLRQLLFETSTAYTHRQISSLLLV